MLAIVLSLWLGAYWLRRWIVPEFSGAVSYTHLTLPTIYSV